MNKEWILQIQRITHLVHQIGVLVVLLDLLRFFFNPFHGESLVYLLAGENMLFLYSIRLFDDRE